MLCLHRDKHQNHADRMSMHSRSTRRQCSACASVACHVCSNNLRRQERRRDSCKTATGKRNSQSFLTSRRRKNWKPDRATHHLVRAHVWARPMGKERTGRRKLEERRRRRCSCDRPGMTHLHQTVTEYIRRPVRTGASSNCVDDNLTWACVSYPHLGLVARLMRPTNPLQTLTDELS